jgi:hypothetical protein
MKPPSVRFSCIGFEHDRLVGGQFGDADRVEIQRLAARCSIVLTLTLYLGCWTVADTICVPSFSQ